MTRTPIEQQIRASLHSVAEATPIPPVPLATDRPAGPKSLRHKGALGVVGVAVVLSTAAAGYAVLRAADTATELGCSFEPGSVSVIDAVSGDPVADCGAQWRRDFGTEPPALVAYDTGTGGVAVAPADATVPDGWTPLETTERLDARQIELESALADLVDGLPARCLDERAGERRASAELARLGLESWSVTTERRELGPADGVTTCAAFLNRDPDNQQVRLYAEPSTTGQPPTPATRLAGWLRTLLATECLGRADAVDAARSAARAEGITEVGNMIAINAVPDEEAACSRLDLLVGGNLQVTVRGPAATRDQ